MLPQKRRSSDVASQEDDKAGERKKDIVGMRRGLKTMAATFSAEIPSSKSSLIDSDHRNSPKQGPELFEKMVTQTR